MYSKHVLFEEIVEGVKDDIGAENLRNQYGKIRRLIYRCEQDIGFGNSLIMKRKTFTVENGGIIISGKNRRIMLPDDIVKIESFGMCQEGICQEDYKIQGKFLFLCKPVDKFSFIYYTLMCDGEGNPMVTQNHKEAVISGVTYFMYKSKVWNRDGSQSYLRELKDYYEDRIGESRGDDSMPNTQEEWSEIAKMFRMSYSEMLVYNSKKNCYCAIEDSTVIVDNDVSEIYYWQYSDFVSNIDLAQGYDLDFIKSQLKIPLNQFLEGNLFSYESIGRIAFAIVESNENQYNISDILDNNITDIVFDKYYNSSLKTQYYISKEFYSISDIYFKIKKN